MLVSVTHIIIHKEQVFARKCIFLRLKLFAFLIRITDRGIFIIEETQTGRDKSMSDFLFTPMTRFYAEALAYMKKAAGAQAGNAAGAGVSAGSFAGAVQDQLAQKEQNAVQSMSMNQYKAYIYQQISDLPTSATQKWDAVSVNISDEGFAAMKADPTYEKWVLDTLRRDFAFTNPWSAYAGGSYRVHYFGATKEEYRGESFQMGFRNGGKHTDSAKKNKQKSFWEKRAERHKLYMDLATKAWYQRENEREYQEKIDLGRKEVSSALLRQQALERATGEKVELGVDPDVLSQAAAELAQNFVFFKIPSALTNPKPKAGK